MVKGKILFLEWKSFGNEHIVPVFKKLGYEVISFKFRQDEEDARMSETLANEVAQKILQEKPDLVFSFNYYPTAAIACKACRVKYVTWIYDSPFIMMYSRTIEYDTNRVFHFDSSEVAKFRAMGIRHIHYLPMGAATTRYDAVIPSAEDRRMYESDITFIGSTYSEERNHMFRHLTELDDHTAGYVDALMQAQMGIYGMDVIEPSLTPEIIEKMQKVCPVFERGDGLESTAWVFANYFLLRKVTAMERQLILSQLSERFKVRLFTPEKTPQLPHVINMGQIDYYDRMPTAMKCAKINLNISLRSIHTGIPLRAMDILGCGGFLLTNYQQDLFEHFVPGEDFVFYENPGDVTDIAEYYLAHEDERKRIAENGHRKAKELFSYEVQVEKMLELV